MENCFAMKPDGCHATIEGVSCSDCPFYKTEAERSKSLEAAHARLREMPFEKQSYYAGKYYRGMMPWEIEGGF